MNLAAEMQCQHWNETALTWNSINMHVARLNSLVAFQASKGEPVCTGSALCNFVA
jgi:hypothetical protein